MSAGPPLDQVHLALGHDPLDRRADLRTAGWSAVPGERVLVLLDPTGDVAVTRAGPLGPPGDGVAEAPLRPPPTSR